MFGFVPLILGGGGFWPPLAVAIAGGVVGATLLAIYFIPAAYLLLATNKFQAINMPKYEA
jgi:multidrug efflux pump subunit AcrB